MTNIGDKKKLEMSRSRFGTLTLVTGGVAAVAAAGCCAGPRLAAVFGCKIRWLAHLFTALAPYHPLFIAVAATAFGVAHYRLYGTPLLWAGGGTRSAGLRRQRAALWLLGALCVAVILTPLSLKLP